MADRRRIITFSSDTVWPYNYGGRPILEVDLEIGGTFQAIQDTFAYQPGQSNQLASRDPSRYGGQQVMGEQNDNGTVTWQALVQGNTPDQVAGNIESLLAAANNAAASRLLEWRPDGSTFSSYARIAGPGTWKPTYSWAQWQGAKSMVVDVSFPVRPLWLWDPMTVGDPFDVDSSADYTIDAAGGTTTISGGNITASTNLTAERGWRHTARGYKLLEGQAQLQSNPNTVSVTGYKAGVRLRASSASTYVEVYVDDNGTNSRLRVDVIIGGTRTNRASSNLAARVAAASSFYVRGRIEGQTVIAEYFIAGVTPALGTTATLSTSYTLSGGEQTSLVAGYVGFSWIPQAATATILRFDAQPFTWRALATPQLVQPLDAIPGVAPALCDVTVATSSSDSAAPAWPLIAWARYTGQTGGAQLGFGVFDAENFTSVAGGWASSSQASSHGGFDLRVTTSGAGTYTAHLSISPYFEDDEFSDGEFEAEVWARVIVNPSLVAPRIRMSLAGAATVDTLEYGSAGKLLTLPSSGTVYRMVRLGTLTLETNIADIKFTATVAVGSSGVFGMDYVQVIASRRRAAGVTGVPLAQVSSFVPDTAGYLKQVRNDLSSTILGASGTSPARSAGPGGTLIQPSAGMNWWLLKLSSLVPDDYTVDGSSELLAHTASLALDVMPRSYMLRSA